MRRLLFVVPFLAACRASAPAADTAPTPPRESDVMSALSVLAADSMEGRRAGSPGAWKAERYVAERFRALGLAPAGDSGYFQRVPFRRIERQGRQSLAPLASWAAFDTVPADQRVVDYNVVAVIPGSDPALRDESVFIGAHHDHIGIARGSGIVNGDSINNGADDDASGVVAVLEVARALSRGPRPKRTVVVGTLTAEEYGMLGTTWYVAHPARPIEKMVAGIFVEMIGRPDSLAGGAGRAWLTGEERSTMGAMLRAAGLAVGADPRPPLQLFERSDNIVFARRGVPAHTLSTYNGHADYHRVTDDVSRVDAAHMTRVVDIAVRAVRLLADSAAPRWNEGGRPTPR